jgi:hypothetical protein
MASEPRDASWTAPALPPSRRARAPLRRDGGWRFSSVNPQAEQEKLLAAVNLLPVIKEKTKDIKTWRDKKLSHNDLQKALGSFSLPPIQKKDLTDTLELIPRIMNLIHRHFSDTTVMYEMCVTSNDGDSLLFYLEYGLDVWEEDKRNHNVDRLHKLNKIRTANKNESQAD